MNYDRLHDAIRYSSATADEREKMLALLGGRPKQARTLLEVLDELDELVSGADDKKSWAIFVMGNAMGIAAKAGWTVAELEAMGLVAKPSI